MKMIDTNIIHDPHGVEYSKHTLTKGSPIRGSYTVKDGTESIKGIAFRKQEELSSIMFPEGLLSIGDASFGHCKALKKVMIPSSVEYIGVAAFCKSGLEEVTFLGTPKEIDRNAFLECNNLKRIYVPIDKKQFFTDCFGKDCQFDIEELTSAQKVNERAPVVKLTRPTVAKRENRDLFGNVIIKHSHFDYNSTSFDWIVDDEVKLSELFCGPTFLKGNPSYQFRKKALFIFIKSTVAQQTNTARSDKYTLGANVAFFQKKYVEKYGNLRSPVRIFIFVCDDNEHARFYDEVRFIQIANNSIIVKSLIRN